MSESSKIEWTDSTFNPWIGCTKVGPGCDHCYAEALMDVRHRRVQWGAGQPRARTSADNWKAPLSWNKHPFYECLDCGNRFAPDRRKEGFITCPACSPHKGRKVQDVEDGSRIKQVRRRVFCASLADVFDNEVAPAWRRDLLELIAKTPNLDWLLLTKRIGQAHRMLDEALDVMSHGLTRWADAPWPNVWLGATVVNQEEAGRDIPKLLAVPARVRFLSVEPMLGPVDLKPFFWQLSAGTCRHETRRDLGLAAIDWVIAGGESGHQAREMRPDWARSLRDQCRAAEVPFLFKQWGEFAPWAQDASETVRVGKKAAGRQLDGREWSGFPT